MDKVDRLEEWPKLVIHLDDTLFKVNSSRHMSLDDNLIFDLGPNFELVHITRSGSVVVEDSKDVDIVPVRVFGEFGDLSSAGFEEETYIKTEKVEQSIIDGVSRDYRQLLISSLEDLRSLPRVWATGIQKTLPPSRTFGA
jgi:hypothetical protein